MPTNQQHSLVWGLTIPAQVFSVLVTVKSQLPDGMRKLIWKSWQCEWILQSKQKSLPGSAPSNWQGHHELMEQFHVSS